MGYVLNLYTKLDIFLNAARLKVVYLIFRVSKARADFLEQSEIEDNK